MTLVASGLSKHYDGVAALSGAGLTLAAGEVHALVGENGAGKSTLVKIISGVVRPDAGGIRLDGRAVEFHDARDAAAHGVAVVSQELATFGDLSVLENLFPYGLPRRFGLVSSRLMAERAAPVLAELGLAELGLELPLQARAGDLGLAERQLLEIARALLHRPRVLILDEPTSALPRDAAARLVEVLRRLTGNGLAVLYISHFLEEVMSVADRITVLRDGGVVLPAAVTVEVDLDTLVHAMLGTGARPGPAADPGSGTRPGPAEPAAAPRGRAAAVRLVELTGVSVPGKVRDVALAVAGGEIVGMAGLQGAGHHSVLDLVCGRLRPASGTVRLPGGRAARTPRAALAAGVAYVSGDRRGRGLMPDKALWENVTQVSWLGLGRGGMLPRRAGLVATATRYLDELGVRAAGPYQRAGALSGGNQQKLVLAKWLAAAPEVLVLDDPTRGVDVGARAELHDLVRGLAQAGRAVLVTSTDLAELVELCDRVLVFQHGRVVRTLSGGRLTEHELSLAMNAGFTAIKP